VACESKKLDIRRALKVLWFEHVVSLASPEFSFLAEIVILRICVVPGILD
jgi:hypothetical protein